MQELKDYILENARKGYSFEQIQNLLVNIGWNPLKLVDVIEECRLELEQETKSDPFSEILKIKSELKEMRDSIAQSNSQKSIDKGDYELLNSRIDKITKVILQLRDDINLISVTNLDNTIKYIQSSCFFRFNKRKEPSPQCAKLGVPNE